jgi:hypothetical protein
LNYKISKADRLLEACGCKKSVNCQPFYKEISSMANKFRKSKTGPIADTIVEIFFSRAVILIDSISISKLISIYFG